MRCQLEPAWTGMLVVCLMALGAAGCGDTTEADDGQASDAGADGIGADGSDPAVCDVPNPIRAVVSEDLLELEDILDDGGFEAGTTEVTLLEVPGPSRMGVAERRPQAARTGDFGYNLRAGSGEGITLAVRADVEKGEHMRLSMWARSHSGSVDLRPTVFWVMDEGDLGQPELGDEVTVGEEWTELALETETTNAIRYALFGVSVTDGTEIDVDDVAVELPFWRMAEYADGESRTVGGIEVPLVPAAPVHFNVLIHVEDPNLLQVAEDYFFQRTAVFSELARVLHEHGGFLTIQPEQDWVLAADTGGFDPGLLTELAEGYGVVYSTHTHGPNCRDASDNLYSASDCHGHPEYSDDLSDDDIVRYVGDLAALIEAASGEPVRDHNGNFTFDQSTRFAEVGMETWSAFKNRTTQRTYDALIINPWRPSQVDAERDIDAFLTHDPTVDLVYVPGWGQVMTRHPDRVPSRLPRLLSQAIAHADPDRVNSFYVVTHVDHFYSRLGDRDYITYDEQTGEVTYSAEFLEHLAYWDQALSEVVDPLVEEGYLTWTSLPEIGQLYREWEVACGR